MANAINFTESERAPLSGITSECAAPGSLGERTMDRGFIYFFVDTFTLAFTLEGQRDMVHLHSYFDALCVGLTVSGHPPLRSTSFSCTPHREILQGLHHHRGRLSEIDRGN